MKRSEINAKRFAMVAVVGFSAAVGVADCGSDVAVIPAPRTMTVGCGFCTNDDVRVETDASVPPEGYRLSVRQDGVRIVSSDAAGRFYANETLKQLKKPDGWPCVEIEDAPAFRWRGMHFDDCRHFFGKQTLKRTLDLMARYKYNVLCWHLTEDQGWRIEVPGRPELVTYGSVRSQSPRHRATWRKVDGKSVMDDMDETRYGPFYYTEREVKEIIAYAKERQIEIVPEIEMPGHINAALSAYPEYACRPGNLADRDPRCTWGQEEDVLCLGNPEALAFVDEVLAYVAKTFPAKYIVFWGEECPAVRWESCPKCQALMKREGISDPRRLLGWFTRRMVGVIEKLGKRAIGADDCLVFGDAPKSLIGLYWRDFEPTVNGAQGVELGHDMIMIPFQQTYFYLGQGLSADVDPFQYGSVGWSLTLAKTYGFDPAKGVREDLLPRVLGGMGCNWSEYTWNEYDLEWKMWPRGCAMAEVLWCGKHKPGFDDFKRRVARHRVQLIREGVNCAPLE